MLLLITVLPSVLRGSCDLKGIGFQFWIASLGLRGIFFLNLNFYSKLCIKGYTKPDLGDIGKISCIIYFMIPLQLPFLEKVYIKEAQQTVHNSMEQVVSLTIALDLSSQGLVFFWVFVFFKCIFETLFLNQ